MKIDMDIKIETKFKDGDEVYIIDHGYIDGENVARWHVFGPRKILKTKIYVVNDGIEIIYRFSEEYSDSEEFCFSTKEKAQVEADRRNNEATKQTTNG